VKINLNPYCSRISRHIYGSVSRHELSSYRVLNDFREGQQAARDTEIAKFVGEKIELYAPDDLIATEEVFLSGLLRPLLRKQGVEKTKELVTTTNGRLKANLFEFFMVEARRENEKMRTVKTQADPSRWAAPSRFFVPDIGTVVRLTEDWTFRLFSEGRNSPLFEILMPSLYQNLYSNYPKESDVTFKAGSMFKVDRVYIRKGVSDYSSLTFNAVKGKDTIAVYNGKEFVMAKKGARFWAKLSDVNNMVVEVDQSTLAEN